VQPALSPNRDVLCARHSIAWSSSRTTLSTARMWSRSLLCRGRQNAVGLRNGAWQTLHRMAWHRFGCFALAHLAAAAEAIGRAARRRRAQQLQHPRAVGTAQFACGAPCRAPRRPSRALWLRACAWVFFVCACACVPWHGIHSHRYTYPSTKLAERPLEYSRNPHSGTQSTHVGSCTLHAQGNPTPDSRSPP
jgi:hypothetical protein